MTFERPSAPAHAQGGLGSKPEDVAPSPIDAERNCDARRGTVTRHDHRGERNPFAKLTTADVVAMREAYAAGGVTLTQLGARFGISFGAASKIVRGLAWPHAGGPLTKNPIGRNGGDTRSAAARARRAPPPPPQPRIQAPPPVPLAPYRYVPPLDITFHRSSEDEPWREVSA